MNKTHLKSIERYGSLENYQKELAHQRTQEYKAKRNPRCNKLRARKKIEAIEVELKQLRNLKAINDSFIYINAVKKVENTLSDLKKLF